MQESSAHGLSLSSFISQILKIKKLIINCRCFDAEDIHQAPTGIIGLSFDDGPTEAAPALLQYLRSQNLSATHFVIGSRIVDNPQAILAAVAQGEHVSILVREE